MHSVTDPYGSILGFLDRSGYFFQVAEAEGTPFQNHYFTDNLIAPGIDPDLWICGQEL
jgi:hypothetical protein